MNLASLTHHISPIRKCWINRLTLSNVRKTVRKANQFLQTMQFFQSFLRIVYIVIFRKAVIIFVQPTILKAQIWKSLRGMTVRFRRTLIFFKLVQSLCKVLIVCKNPVLALFTSSQRIKNRKQHIKETKNSKKNSIMSSNLTTQNSGQCMKWTNWLSYEMSMEAI